MTLVASILTPGAPEAAAIYNDTLYVADDERGIAIIALKPEPHYLKNIITEANHGFIWVGYDSLRHKLLASDLIEVIRPELGRGWLIVCQTMDDGIGRSMDHVRFRDA